MYTPPLKIEMSQVFGGSFKIGNSDSPRKKNIKKSYALKGTLSKCPQIYIKLTGFEGNESGNLPFK